MEETGDNVIRLGAAAEQLRDDFLHWQCRIRQMAMRDGGGRPSPGMRPAILAEDGTELHPGIVVVVHPRELEESTALFRHQVLKTQDPSNDGRKPPSIWRLAISQRPGDFDEHLTALFGPEAPIADIALNHGKVILSFAEFGQRFRLPVSVVELPEHDPALSIHLLA